MWTRVGHIWHVFILLPIWRSVDCHTWRHLRRHVCLHSREWAHYMERAMVCPYVKISLWVDFYMTCKDQIFVDDVVVINPMWEMVAFSVISWLVGVATKLNTIAKIHKYKRLHERHHFILMAMEVHGSPGRDMDHFIKECVGLFHNRWSRGHLSLSFCIQFFKWHGNIAF